MEKAILYSKFSLKLLLSIFCLGFSISAFADADLSRVFSSKSNEKFEMHANLNLICVKESEVITYTMFTPAEGVLYSCALTYHYSSKKTQKSNFKTDKLIRYSQSYDKSCQKKLDELLDKVKKLGFECTASGIG